jgi:hypothetical protein
MAAVTSKVQICNLAVSGIGNRNTISNIDTPKTDKEVTFAQWYDVVRQYCIKTMMPNFALNRVVVSQKEVPTAYARGYGFALEYPVTCLKVLGIGAIDAVEGKNYIVEGNTIYTNIDVTQGGYLRIVEDITNVTMYTSDFVLYFASELGKRTALSVTQDPSKKNMAMKDAQLDAANVTGLNAQENKPIRKSTSKFRQARYSNPSMHEEKR